MPNRRPNAKLTLFAFLNLKIFNANGIGYCFDCSISIKVLLFQRQAEINPATNIMGTGNLIFSP
jgi:hypothetical protein